jgi:cytochrome c biogenesis factor
VRVAVLDSSCSAVKAELEPRINTYKGSAQPIGTPDVWTGFVDDVYIGIAGGTTETIELNVFVFPLQWLLWIGGSIVVLGGVVALGRKPRKRPRTSDDVTAEETGTANV